ncbi:hypothetical protein ACJX0J_022550 [Zea mays]
MNKKISAQGKENNSKNSAVAIALEKAPSCHYISFPGAGAIMQDTINILLQHRKRFRFFYAWLPLERVARIKLGALIKYKLKKTYHNYDHMIQTKADINAAAEKRSGTGTYG